MAWVRVNKCGMCECVVDVCVDACGCVCAWWMVHACCMKETKKRRGRGAGRGRGRGGRERNFKLSTYP